MQPFVPVHLQLQRNNAMELERTALYRFVALLLFFVATVGHRCSVLCQSVKRFPFSTPPYFYIHKNARLNKGCCYSPFTKQCARPHRRGARLGDATPRPTPLARGPIHGGGGRCPPCGMQSCDRHTPSAGGMSGSGNNRQTTRTCSSSTSPAAPCPRRPHHRPPPPPRCSGGGGDGGVVPAPRRRRPWSASSPPAFHSIHDNRHL